MRDQGEDNGLGFRGHVGILGLKTGLGTEGSAFKEPRKWEDASGKDGVTVSILNKLKVRHPCCGARGGSGFHLITQR